MAKLKRVIKITMDDGMWSLFYIYKKIIQQKLLYRTGKRRRVLDNSLLTAIIKYFLVVQREGILDEYVESIAQQAIEYEQEQDEKEQVHKVPSTCTDRRDIKRRKEGHRFVLDYLGRRCSGPT
jgi:hypothetical protein